MSVPVAHRTAVENHRMIQQVSVAIRRVLQFFQEVRNETNVITVELCEIRDSRRILAMMRTRVKRSLHATLRKHTLADVATNLERRHARRVSHKRERLQLKHQLH